MNFDWLDERRAGYLWNSMHGMIQFTRPFVFAVMHSCGVGSLKVIAVLHRPQLLPTSLVSSSLTLSQMWPLVTLCCCWTAERNPHSPSHSLMVVYFLSQGFSLCGPGWSWKEHDPIFTLQASYLACFAFSPWQLARMRRRQAFAFPNTLAS